MITNVVGSNEGASGRIWWRFTEKLFDGKKRIDHVVVDCVVVGV